MEENIKDNFIKVKNKDLDYIIGQMEKFTKEDGNKVNSKVKQS